jgi:serine/threonine protein phosphatase PrpC
VANVGDSAAFILDDHGQLSRATPLDNGHGNRLTDCLGRIQMRGHLVHVPRRRRIVLCTDGVHRVVASSVLAQALASSRSLETEVKRILGEVADAGTPDDATVLIVEDPGAPPTGRSPRG